LKELKNYIVLFIIAGLVIFAVMHYDLVWGAILYILHVFMPFIIGGCIAFVMGIPIKFLEKHLLKRLPFGARRTISILITLFVILGFVVLIVALIIPEIVKTTELIMKETPSLYRRILKFMNEGTGNKEYDEVIKQAYTYISQYQHELQNAIKNASVGALGGATKFLSALFGGVVNAFLGTIFAIMALAAKEKLIRQSKLLLLATVGKKPTIQILKVSALSADIFEKFVAGQCIEACIAGVSTFIAMLFINSQYALMVSVIVLFFALIPAIGVITGTTLAALILLTSSFWDSLAIVIFIIIFQQIDNNFIYPKVVGKSIGLPGLWVIVAVMAGGTLWGAGGIILGVPLCSVAYALIRLYVYKKVPADAAEQLAITHFGDIPSSPPTT
jgi:predicted PurR-regulated permease PerM